MKSFRYVCIILLYISYLTGCDMSPKWMKTGEGLYFYDTVNYNTH